MQLACSVVIPELLLLAAPVACPRVRTRTCSPGCGVVPRWPPPVRVKCAQSETMGDSASRHGNGNHVCQAAGVNPD